MSIKDFYRVICSVCIAVCFEGCAALNPVDRLSVEVDSRLAASASGYVSRSHPDRDAAIDTMEIQLGVAPPFVIRLPDGHRVNSRQVDRRLLLEHDFMIVENGEEECAFGTTPPGWGPLHDPLLYRFRLDPDGKAYSVTLRACGNPLSDVLETVDGGHRFAMPMSRGEFERLLGVPAKLERFNAISGWVCG